MSKPSRRQEIQTKEKLQAKFQQSLAQNSDLILAWLAPKNNAIEGTSALSNGSFFDLPIIPNGSSLSSLESNSSSIGQFMSGGMDALASAKNATSLNPPSKAMTALIHKMRDSKRDRIREAGKKESYKRPALANQHKKVTKPIHPLSVDSDDSDDGTRARANRSVKKGVLLKFSGKKARPF